MKKGFTLIELLVVIAIIAILAAILFPVFAQAREKARQSSCLSNCKQIGTALNLYVDDYDETLPPRLKVDTGWNNQDTFKGYPRYSLGYTYDILAGRGVSVLNNHGPKNITWMDCIFPYVKNLNLFLCPSVSLKNATLVSWGWNGRQSGYAINHFLSQPSYLGIGNWNIPQCTGYVTSSDGLPVVPSRSLTELKNIGETVFVCDTLVDTDAGASTPRSHTAICSYYLDNVGTDNSATKSTWNNVTRHLTGANFTYCDGHSKYYKRKQGPLDSGASASGSRTGDKYWNPDIQ